jgi:hypothetical protein
MKQLIRESFGVKNRQVFAYHRYPFNFLKQIPDFMVIGSQKAATTTLHSILSSHPLLKPSIIKETQFFNMNYERGIRYYKSLFPIKFKNQLTFESTPDYFDHPLVPKRLYEIAPNIKLIVTIREPVSRTFSHYNFVQSYNLEIQNVSFHEALNIEKNKIENAITNLELDIYNSARDLSNFGFVRKSEYINHLNNWLKYFNLSQFYFIEFDEISKMQQEVFDGLFEFLGIPPIKLEKNVKENTT